jgi:RHS repeat-associated protein
VELSACPSVLQVGRRGGRPDTYTYDLLGNITSKSDYADNYLYTGTGPHAVSSVTNQGQPKASFTYDANGNMITGDGRQLGFDNLDRPITVTMGSTVVQFRYAPDGTRYVQSTSGGTNNEYYVDKLFEQVETGTSIEGRTHVSDIVEVVQSQTRKVRYRHQDRLGSLEAATTETGTEDLAYGHGYDAFGDPRSRDWQSSSDQMGQTDERGFTGHEHLDNLRLIHMNGRVYDYKLGRFLSVDPIISNPANSQSINPYSYIGNNPLSGVDPTGYEPEQDTEPFVENERGCFNICRNGNVSIGANSDDNSTKNNYASLPNGGCIAWFGGGGALAPVSDTYSSAQTAQQLDKSDTQRLPSLTPKGTIEFAKQMNDNMNANITGLAREFAFGVNDLAKTIFTLAPSPTQEEETARDPEFYGPNGLGAFLRSPVGVQLAAAFVGSVAGAEPIANVRGPSGPPGGGAPTFVVTPNAEAIPVPSGAAGPTPVVNPQGNTTGFAYTGGTGGPGLDPRVSTVRIMDPTLEKGSSPGYPGGYVTYQNAARQVVDPSTGRTIAPSNPAWHIPMKE